MINDTFQRLSFLPNQEICLLVINQEIDKIKDLYPSFNLTYLAKTDNITFTHNNISILQLLISNIKVRLQVECILDSDHYITLSY